MMGFPKLKVWHVVAVAVAIYLLRRKPCPASDALASSPTALNDTTPLMTIRRTAG